MCSEAASENVVCPGLSRAFDDADNAMFTGRATPLGGKRHTGFARSGATTVRSHLTPEQPSIYDPPTRAMFRTLCVNSLLHFQSAVYYLPIKFSQKRLRRWVLELVQNPPVFGLQSLKH